MLTSASKILIIGAGPTGLGAGYRLKELGHHNFTVYDRLSHLGGLASSFTDSAGFTWDVGGHVMFSHYPYYDRVFERLMGNDFQLNTRECWVRMLGTWVPYPVQNNIRHLPKEVIYECLVGLIEAQTRWDRRSCSNFREFVDVAFGLGLAKYFMLPYNFKVWAHSAEIMGKDWINERVAKVDFRSAIRSVVLGTDDLSWGPNRQFKYPSFGGTGEFYRRFEYPLRDHIQLDKPVRSINLLMKECSFQDGQVVKYDALLSTVPLDKLCNEIICGQLPPAIGKATAELRHSSGYMVGIGIRQPCPDSKSWMYFPEDTCPFYRVTYLSNYSPRMTPDSATHYSLLCETSYSEFKPVDGTKIVENTIRGLINAGVITEQDQNDIVDIWLYDANYSYPVPTVGRDSILSQTIPFLENHGIFSRGRFGMWKYEVSNTDHAFMQGVELVNRLVLGESETTIHPAKHS